MGKAAGRGEGEKPSRQVLNSAPTIPTSFGEGTIKMPHIV